MDTFVSDQPSGGEDVSGTVDTAPTEEEMARLDEAESCTKAIEKAADTQFRASTPAKGNAHCNQACADIARKYNYPVTAVYSSYAVVFLANCVVRDDMSTWDTFEHRDLVHVTTGLLASLLKSAEKNNSYKAAVKCWTMYLTSRTHWYAKGVVEKYALTDEVASLGYGTLFYAVKTADIPVIDLFMQKLVLHLLFSSRQLICLFYQALVSDEIDTMSTQWGWMARVMDLDPKTVATNDDMAALMDDPESPKMGQLARAWYDAFVQVEDGQYVFDGSTITVYANEHAVITYMPMLTWDCSDAQGTSGDVEMDVGENVAAKCTSALVDRVGTLSVNDLPVDSVDLGNLV